MADLASHWQKIGAFARITGVILGIAFAVPASATADPAGQNRVAAEPARPTANPATSDTTPRSDAGLAEFIIGRWAPAGLCADAIEFKPGGRIDFRANNAVAMRGTWSLNGNRLTLTVDGQQGETGSVARSGNNLVLTDPGGTQTQTAERCS